MMAGNSSISSDVAEENEDELFKPKSRTSTTNLLLKWEGEEDRIHSSLISHNPLPTPPSHGWSMVLIKDNHQEDCSSLIFPPIHHENLQVLEKPLTPSSSSPSSSSCSASELLSEVDDESTSTLLSPSNSNRPVGGDTDSPVIIPRPRGRHAADVARWLNFGLEMLYSKVRGVFWLFHSPVKVSAFTTAAMVVGFLYFRWRRRRVMVEQEDRDRLVRIIREKDEKINELLNQIARMNNVFLALQRVPAAAPPKTH